MSIGGGFTLSPSYEPQKAVGPEVQSQHKLGFNRMFYLDANYTATSLLAIGAHIGSSRTSMVLDDDRALNGVNWGAQYNWDDHEHELRFIAGSPDIRDRYYGVYIKRFLYSKGALAPVGTYFKAGLTSHNYTIDFSNVRYISYSHLGFDEYDQLQHKHKDSIGTASYTEISMAFGKSIPVVNRVLLDIAMEGGLHAALFKPSADNWRNPTELTYDLLRERLARAHYLKFSFGLNFLLF
jgi:hypothetical protein